MVARIIDRDGELKKDVSINSRYRLAAIKNEEFKIEKVNQKVKECFRTKAQNGQAKILHKEKDAHVYNNCLKLRSRVITM